MAGANETHEKQQPPIKNLFLIGYRGTGKSTVARLLAAKMGWRWIDADAVLEEHFGRSIRLIFEEEGEAGFRQKETTILEVLCRSSKQVIATGGGVVLSAANRQRLRAAGRVIWLVADADVLWQRLQADGTTRERRPPLAGGGLAEIQELLEVRKPLYQECAELTINTTDHSPEAIAGQILNFLGSEKVAE